MAFSLSPDVKVVRDGSGRITQLSHLQQPYRATAALATTPRSLAASYLADVAGLYRLPAPALTTLHEPVDHRLRAGEDDRLRLLKERRQGRARVVSYRQTVLGLPVWGAAFTVRLQEGPTRVTASDSSLHDDVDVDAPPKTARFLPGRRAVETGLRALAKRGGGDLVKITDQRLVIYRFDPAERVDANARPVSPRPLDLAPSPSELGPILGRPSAGPAIPTLPLPEVPDSIEPGRHYVCNEVLFTLNIGRWPALHWRALIDVRSGAVLHLRAFITTAFGNVFVADPITLTGDTSITACSPADTLDPLTSVVTLPGLSAPTTPGAEQSLTGEYVALGEISTPTVAAPTAELPSGNFSFSAPTDDFGAVNTYYSTDRAFRFMEDVLGIDVSDYFVDTAFPLPVDHRDDSLGVVNAVGYGSATGAAGGMGFNLANASCSLGIASDFRVVLHEFCHELLWENVGDFAFGFAHSAGDSLAAILHDPTSNAPDRGLTFPFVADVVDRRHDRPVDSGYAWGGANDDRDYESEQILSTTLFRVYQSTGGDSVDVATRELAARYLAATIIKGIGLLTETTTDPTVYVDALVGADTGTELFEGIAGGGIHKVIRWSFEQQGLFQPDPPPSPGTVDGPGAPPDVDVYIDDGRDGQYQYQEGFWNSTAVWNRLGTDPGDESDHETPVVGVPNNLFVRVKNRGTRDATDVVVRTFHCRPASGLVWPDDWVATTTGELAVPGAIDPGGDVIVGPFEWTPEVIGHECLLAEVSAPGDRSNIDEVGGLPAALGPIPHWRLVPFDNNLAQRNVAPVAGGGGSGGLTDSFAGRTFTARNPYDRPATIELRARLPRFLVERGWELRFANPGGSRFTLGPRSERVVVLDLRPGRDFSTADLSPKDRDVTVVSSIDGMTVGGMTWRVDGRLRRPPRERAGGPSGPKGGASECRDHAERLLDCLDLPSDGVARVRVRRITLDIEFGDEC